MNSAIHSARTRPINSDRQEPGPPPEREGSHPFPMILCKTIAGVNGRRWRHRLPWSSPGGQDRPDGPSWRATTAGRRSRSPSEPVHPCYPRENAFEADILPPVEPIRAHGYQQIDAGQPRVCGTRPDRMPKHIDTGGIGLARLVYRNHGIAADVPVRERHACGKWTAPLIRTVARRAKPRQPRRYRQPFRGTIGIEGKR